MVTHVYELKSPAILVDAVPFQFHILASCRSDHMPPYFNQNIDA